ncbi:MAG: adenine deaminase, partial [Phycisphaerales bacterium]|nr:adenine deaminase [Phycisphaerales bacterium]
DPHEIANVLGIPGIRYLMDNARGLPLNFMFAASSCVPSSPLETAGAVLSAADLAPLFDEPEVVALAEMMNFPGVFLGVPEVLEKVNLGLGRRLVDGHAPGLAGRGLDAYVAAGISSDHECTTAAEALEKLRRGMQIYIREGSAARNLDALLPLVTPANAHRFCFCTDDRHPGDLRDEGHIDHVIRRAVASGLDPLIAIAMGSTHVAQHYRQPHLGAIAPGRQADMVVLDDLRQVRVRDTWVRGVHVASNGAYIGVEKPVGTYPASGVRLPAGLDVSSFRVPVTKPGAPIRVIGMSPTQLVTQRVELQGTVDEGAYVADVKHDVLKMVVIERHNGTGNIGRGFVQGFKLKSGALASTVGHDSHNLAIVGTNDEDMLAAAKALASCGGGQCVVRDGVVLALLPLPIAGLMSDQPAETVVNQQAGLLEAARQLGCPHHDPFMPLSFMPLPVIPSLKLSDLGLVDVDAFAVVPLEV